MRLVPLFSLVLLIGCDSVGDGPRSLPGVDVDAAIEATLADLTAAREAWEAAGIDAYEVRYVRSCFCAGREFQVRVEGGAVTDYWVDGERPVPDAGFGEGSTLDQLFATAVTAFETADQSSARVLPGAAPFLTEVYIDYESRVADDEFGYQVVGFERLD